MYLMGSTRCGISAKQIQRETGVTYKTAWRMFKQIRSLMSENVRLGGSESGAGGVEVDEAYFGGRRKSASGRMLRGDINKTAVIGLVERKGCVAARVTRDVKAETVLPIIKECILPESTVFTDEFPIYNSVPRMDGMGYEHRRINHDQKIYVMGDVHTNTIEGFWSLVKRGIGGVYHAVSTKYLQSYLDEYSFRYNRRDSGNLIFPAMLARVSELASSRPSQ